MTCRYCLSTFAALAVLTGMAQETVPWHTARDFRLPAREGHEVLALEMWFRAEQPTYHNRRAVIAVNGRALGPEHLLSPRFLTQMRHPGGGRPRFDADSNRILFPHIHKRHGLAEFDYPQVGEYDKWVQVFEGFAGLTHFDLRDIPPENGAYLVTIYNNVQGPEGTDAAGNPTGPPLVIEQLELSRELPPRPNDLVLAPGWDRLHHSPATFARAVAELADPATPAPKRAQILAQLGLREQMHGSLDKAIDFWQRALAAAPAFPERNEIVYRLLVHGADPGPDALAKDPPPNAAAWAELYRDWRAARAGEANDRLIVVQRLDDPIRVDGRPEEIVWRRQDLRWQPLKYPVREQDQGVDTPNEVALLYDDAGLTMLFRGPGAKRLEIGDVAGQDLGVWGFNCVELFLTPEGRFKFYYELNHSAGNGRYDARYRWVGQGGAEWQGQWRSRTHLEDGRMTVEYFVPWSDFGLAAGPAAGELWLGNVVRVQHLETADGPRRGEFSARKLLHRYFHRLQDGLILRFE